MDFFDPSADELLIIVMKGFVLVFGGMIITSMIKWLGSKPKDPNFVKTPKRKIK